MFMLGKRTADIIKATQQGKFQGRDEADGVKAEGIDASRLLPTHDELLNLLANMRHLRTGVF